MTGIQRMYQRLCFHFRQPVLAIHLTTYPSALQSLSDANLVRAFNRAEESEQFLPLPGRLRELVACDEQRELQMQWSMLWRNLLTALKRHGPQWEPYHGQPIWKTREDGTSYHDGYGPMIEAPEEPLELWDALDVEFGGRRIGLEWIRDNHPVYFGEDWKYAENPRLAAERIEKRVRDAWEREVRRAHEL
jgi:hypothetical protein